MVKRLAFLVLMVLSVVVGFRRDKQEPDRLSGALVSLGLWHDQRAYPHKTLPNAGYYAAFEYSRAHLQSELDRRVPPWDALGPHNIGGRTLTVAFNPQNPNTIYAGSASGGLWRSFSGGRGARAWEYVPTGFPVLAVSAIAIVPDDSNTIYIGTGEVYNYRNAGTGFAIRPTRGSYGIGVLKSSDGGRTWRKSLDWSAHQERGVWAVRFNPLDANTLWAATTEGVFKSVDAGETWQQVNELIMVMDLVVHPQDSDRVLISVGNLGSEGHGLYRTLDGGQTWEKLSGLPQTFGGKAMLATCPAAPNVVYASIGNGTSSQTGATWLMRSDDFGDSWSLASFEDYSRWQGWFAHDVAVHPQNPDVLLAVGVDIWKSRDAGLTLEKKSDWREWFFGRTIPGEPEGSEIYSHADHHDVVYHPQDPNIVYFATDGGVFRSLDGGETFEGCNGGYQTTQFYQGFAVSQSDSFLSIGGMQDNASAIYDGQVAWIRVIGGDGGHAAIDPQNDDILYGSWQRLNINISEDRGTTWRRIPPPGQEPTSFIAPFVVSPSEPNVLYAGRSVVYKTTTRGRFWAAMNRGQPLDGNPVLALAVSHQTSRTVYATTAPVQTRAGVFRSDNGGSDWVNITGALPDRYPVDIAVDPNDDRVVYVVFSGFGTSHVFKSTDAGATWQDIGQGLPDVPTSAVVVDPLFPDHIYVGNDLGVYVSVDGGATWETFLAGLPDAVIAMDLVIAPVPRKLRVATHGNGAYERDLVGDRATSVPDAPAVVAGFRLEQNYPNPFNPSTTIAYTLPRDSRVELSVFNLRGERVATLVDAFQTRGARTVVWEGRDHLGRPVGSGVYILRLRAGDTVLARRMTLVR